MTFIQVILKDYFSFETIVASVGFVALVTGLFALLVQFPPAKLNAGSPVHKSLNFFRDGVLLLIAFLPPMPHQCLHC